MRKLILPILIVASLGATSAMAAATTTTPTKPATPTTTTATTTNGAISKIDTKDCIVTLDKQRNYHFAAKCDFSKLKVGEKVAVTWTAKGKYRWASAIAAATA